MKKVILTAAVAASIFALQACNNNNAKNDSKANADSANVAKDTSTTATLAVNTDDSQFAVEAANGGLAEVELGKLAQTKATDAKVKDFASMMVTDHTKANTELMNLAKLKNITLPSVPGADEQKIMDDLTKKSGKDFDKAYVDAMVDDHKKDVKAFQDAIKTLKDSDLKAFATKTLPVLQMHLDAITKIQKELK